MQSIKKQVIEFLEKESDDITADEIIEYIIINQKLLEAEEDIKNGRIHTHEEAKEILKRWAK